ncbi:hypothetical protein [Streptomyces sp. NPDC048256]|uniref:hypothetical protein n=1 Tax=unclassified Streptomyces TaxID=2593676 RepID=UPI0033CFCD08
MPSRGYVHGISTARRAWQGLPADGTGPAGIDNRIRALHAADVDLAVALSCAR